MDDKHFVETQENAKNVTNLNKNGFVKTSHVSIVVHGLKIEVFEICFPKLLVAILDVLKNSPYFWVKLYVYYKTFSVHV